MKIVWSAAASRDIDRVRIFLQPSNRGVVKRLIVSIMKKMDLVAQNPRMGERLSRFTNREIRKVVVGGYEVRYEILNVEVVLLRILHQKEHR